MEDQSLDPVLHKFQVDFLFILTHAQFIFSKIIYLLKLTTREDKCLKKSNQIHFRRQLRLISESVCAPPLLLFNTRVESNYLAGGKRMLQLLNKLGIPLC